MTDFMLRQPDARRAERYHLGSLVVVDDFPILWEFFLDDDVRERYGFPRLYSYRTQPGGYASTDPGIWPVLTDRLNRRVQQECLTYPELYREHTVVIEFSRGREQGYRKALEQLDTAILEHGAILYIAVSFAESWRRNVSRYDEKRQAGILAHMVPYEAMRRIYGDDDWPELAPKPAGHLKVNGVSVPYVTMDNEEENTDPQVLDGRYGKALERLWRLWRRR